MRRHASCLLALTFALIVWCTAASAYADPILILVTSGSGSIFPNSDRGGPIELFGTNGFSLSANPGSGITGPGCCLSPGAESSFHASWCCNDLPGIATFGGETFTNLGGPNSANQVTVDFASATFTLPPIAASATIEAPFTLTGTFRGAPGDGNLAQPTVDALLVGSGIGTLTLINQSLASIPAWNPVSITLALSTPITAVPEPSTMLVVGTGLILLGYWERKRLFRDRQSFHFPTASSPTSSASGRKT